MKLGRNDPCHCGSQRKFKDCCAKTSPNSQYQKVVGIFIFVVVGAWFLLDIYSSSKNAGSSLPVNRVWSEEHGHWHDIVSPKNPNFERFQKNRKLDHPNDKSIEEAYGDPIPQNVNFLDQKSTSQRYWRG